MNIRNSGWITASRETRDICPVFRRVFSAKKPVLRAELSVTVLGVYFAELNGRPVGISSWLPAGPATAAGCRSRSMT